MRISRSLHATALAGMLAASPAFAATTTLFIDLPVRNSPPSATLVLTELGSGGMEFLFTHTGSLGQRIQFLEWNYVGSALAAPVVTDRSGFLTGPVFFSDVVANDDGYDFFFRARFPNSSGDRLDNPSEFAKWIVTKVDATPLFLADFLVPVSSTTSGNPPAFAWLFGTGQAGVAPIPEPGTYAMLLAGLGLLGFMARRRMRG